LRTWQELAKLEIVYGEYIVINWVTYQNNGKSQCLNKPFRNTLPQGPPIKQSLYLRIWCSTRPSSGMLGTDCIPQWRFSEFGSSQQHSIFLCCLILFTYHRGNVSYFPNCCIEMTRWFNRTPHCICNYITVLSPFSWKKRQINCLSFRVIEHVRLSRMFLN
jgi:hypothetical protein